MSTRELHLQALLSKYTTDDPSELESILRMRALLDTSMADASGARSVLDRTRYVPGHFTASAFVLSPAGDQLLLIYHSKLRRWLQPGGHIEPADETVIDTAQREVAEEAGVRSLTLLSTGLFDVDIHPIPARRDVPAHEHFDVRLLFRTATLECTAGSDALRFKWIRLDELDLLNADESVARAARKLRR